MHATSYDARLALAASSAGREEDPGRGGYFARYPRSGHSLDVNRGIVGGKRMKGMLALAALLGVLSGCRVQVRAPFLRESLSLSHSFPVALFSPARVGADAGDSERRKLARSRDAFTLEPGKCQAQQGALTADRCSCAATPAFSFAPKSTCRYTPPQYSDPLPWRLSNGAINDRDADRTCLLIAKLRNSSQAGVTRVNSPLAPRSSNCIGKGLI